MDYGLFSIGSDGGVLFNPVLLAGTLIAFVVAWCAAISGLLLLLKVWDMVSRWFRRDEILAIERENAEWEKEYKRRGGDQYADDDVPF